MLELLSRDEFERCVFARDGNKCVVPGCGKTPEDAHHLIERRLWQDKSEFLGYFLENGASLCEWHHRFGAETCVIQPQVLRKWCGIKNVVLPKQFDPTKSYDKWGVELKRPTRASIKYPSTPYCHLSPGYDVNDINLPDLKPFLNQPLIVTVKTDGGNTKLTREFVAARNGTAAEHASFDRLKSEHAKFREAIPEHIIVFGENLAARHSIHYVGDMALSSVFQTFGVYDTRTMLFGSWEEVEEISAKIGYPTVPVAAKIAPVAEEWRLEQTLRSLFEKIVAQGHEGLVLRTVFSFPYGNFEGYGTTNNKSSWRVNALCKMVRAGHIQTDARWDQQTPLQYECPECGVGKNVRCAGQNMPHTERVKLLRNEIHSAE